MGERDKLKDFIHPMLAREADEAFDHKDWLFEIKWDGYRAIAEIQKSGHRFYSRNGLNFEKKYPIIFEELRKIRNGMILDGEVVLLDEQGHPDFQKLQHYSEYPENKLCYYVFDILSLNGKDLCHEPLSKRKTILKDVLIDSPLILYSDHILNQGIRFFEAAKKQHLEGIMGKRMDSPYYPGKRTPLWLKIKNHHTEDAAILGFTRPRGSRKHFGALVLGLKEAGKWKYVGHTGSGFTEQTLNQIYGDLQPLVTSRSPFDEHVKTNAPVTWVKPKLVAEIKYSEWTRDKKLRHPIFLRMRKDKNINETAMATNPVKTKHSVAASKSGPGGQKDEEKVFGGITVKTSHLSKIYWPSEKITKGMVMDYYQQIADYILPYLKGRPESLKRNPNGISDEGFFHKDAGLDAPDWVKAVAIYSESARKDINYILCENRATLAYLNNLGCIELNPWNSTTASLDKPDYLIIDLDPSSKNTFDQVVETAIAFRQILADTGTLSFCKTSGATGIHIYIPTGKKYDYNQVKDFAHLLCTLVNHQLPEFTSLDRNLQKRGNKKIYLDYLQNRIGQTLACVYSIRPRPGATVSTPLQWDEVRKGLDPREFTIRSTLDRINKIGDIFKGVLGKGIDLKKILPKLS